MKKSIKAIMAVGALAIASFGVSSFFSANDVICSNVEALTSGDGVTFESQYAFKRQSNSNSYAFVRTGSSTTSSLCGCDHVNMFLDDGECLEITVWGKRK